ncbi:alpha/beta fold hydrolase [Streptomonospora wellingtoniae]|uniref:Alpha/beta hydrolase n=1 Tax=Streptomonospora wellingtoniae TaxID=3075544 RepID=A0ABU2KSK8_9ACTN|nr:alpha/beta hydrolase [Streptomonospora sp. DSM 45055]MDT0302235.1 alpha/beta hydrolase [Streptomonospora sp. DSM 45055]
MPTATAPPWEAVVAGGDDAPELAARGRDGAGTPVVLLHGLGSTLEEWEPVAELLAPRRAVLAYDLRGHGHSADGAWTVEGHVADLARVISRFALRSPVVAGHGLGGVVATLLATRRGDLSAAVTVDAFRLPRAGLVAEHLGLGPQEAEANAAAFDAFAVDQMTAACSPMPADVFDRLLTSYRAGAFGLPGAALEAMARRAAVRDESLVSLRPGPRATRALWADLASHDTDAVAARLRVPTLTLVTGRPLPPIPGAPIRFGEIFAAHTAHELASRFPCRTSKRLDAAFPGHVSDPHTVAQAIADFLDGLGT